MRNRMEASPRLLAGVLLVSLGLIALQGFAESKKPDSAAKTKLAPLQFLIGEWKGVGQLQRNSTAGAWREKVSWAWQFGEGEVHLAGIVEDGKYFSQMRIASGKEAGEFTLDAVPIAASSPTEAAIAYGGKLDGAERIVFTTDKAPEGAPARITMRIVANGDRLLLLYEKRSPGTQFTRLAEVGYTRVGSGFGQGSTGRECVITGGLGTIAVMHEGQTYYVCCTGCRDYFNDNPAKAIAEYKERKAAEQAEREKNRK